jgi:hypothetical protein
MFTTYEQHRDKSPIDLADHRFPLVFREVGEESSFFRGHVAIVNLLGVDDLLFLQIDFIVAVRTDISMWPLRHCLLSKCLWQMLECEEKGSGESPAR